MDKASQRRWLILGGLLAVTVVAMVYPVDPQTITVNVADPAERSMPATTSATSPAGESAPSARAPVMAALTDLPETIPDPFANKGWIAPPPAPIPVAAPAPVVAPPAPIGPPPLPFKFLGRFNDGGQDVVYLSRGEQMVVAKAGEALDTSYKVIALTANQIEIEYLPTGDRQFLNLGTSDS
ncbi:hypothetical protein [Chitinimonas sp. BJYL2]|uniref:hypothetical protein n=1 Tax=Chitinimonas sp. BJYL2 TaxID=2976696 RepID=UPI0022B32822|nr:hypothetical protein [Chitinimonas sp. BJYL2]